MDLQEILQNTTLHNVTMETDVYLTNQRSTLHLSEIHYTLYMDINGTLEPTISTAAYNYDIHYLMATAYFFLTGIMSILSLFGCVVIVVTYWIYPDLRTSGRKLLVFLSIADFLTALGNLLGIVWYSTKGAGLDDGSTVGYRALCQSHSAITIFSSISSFLWTVAIAVHLYLCIVKRNNQLAKQLTWPFHITCWGVPGAVALLALGLNVLGYDQTLQYPSWCWIDASRHDVILWQYFTGKAWEIAAYIVTAVLYTLIKLYLLKRLRRTRYNLNGHSTQPNHHLISSANRKLTFVPVVFIAVRIWGTIRFIIGAHFHNYATSYGAVWIVPLQGVGDSAQGFANCVLFCAFTTKVRNHLRDALCGICTKRPPEKCNENCTAVPTVEETPMNTLQT